MQRAAAAGQTSLFGDVADSPTTLQLPMVAAPATLEEKIMWEEELIGIAVTQHPFVDAIEGPMYPMFCLQEEDHTCFQDSMCGLQELWGDVFVAIRQVFERTSLAELARRHQKITALPMFAASELIRPRG